MVGLSTKKKRRNGGPAAEAKDDLVGLSSCWAAQLLWQLQATGLAQFGKNPSTLFDLVVIRSTGRPRQLEKDKSNYVDSS